MLDSPILVGVVIVRRHRAPGWGSYLDTGIAPGSADIFRKDSGEPVRPCASRLLDSRVSLVQRATDSGWTTRDTDRTEAEAPRGERCVELIRLTPVFRFLGAPTPIRGWTSMSETFPPWSPVVVTDEGTRLEASPRGNRSPSSSSTNYTGGGRSAGIMHQMVSAVVLGVRTLKSGTPTNLTAGRSSQHRACMLFSRVGGGKTRSLEAAWGLWCCHAVRRCGASSTVTGRTSLESAPTVRVLQPAP